MPKNGKKDEYKTLLESQKCSGGKLAGAEVITESEGFISWVQLLIHSQDIGIIVELWTDELSSSTLLPSL